jgi:hypothetical protein
LDDVGDGTLDDIILGLKSKPYRAGDAVNGVNGDSVGGRRSFRYT